MHALRVIHGVWLREVKVFRRDRTRIFGMVAQPLLFLLVVGNGISSSMRLNAAPVGIDYLMFMYPGIIGMSILFTSIFSAVSIIWDREFGFLKEVLVAPVPRWSVAVGKIVGGATVAVIQSLILIALAPFVGLGLSVAVVLKLLGLAFLISFAVTGLGVLIAARMSTMQGFQGMMGLLIMPLFFLSGGMFPITSAPGWMKPLIALDPLTYGVDALRNAVFSDTFVTVGRGVRVALTEVARKADLIRWDLGQDVAILALAAAVLAAAGALRFSRAE